MSVAGSLRDLDESLGRLRERRSRLDDAMAWSATSSSGRSDRRSLRGLQLQASRTATPTPAHVASPLAHGRPVPHHREGGVGRLAVDTRFASGGRRRRPSVDDSSSEQSSNGRAASLRRALDRLAAMPETVTPVASPRPITRGASRHGEGTLPGSELGSVHVGLSPARLPPPNPALSGGSRGQSRGQKMRAHPSRSRRVRMQLRASVRSPPVAATRRVRSSSPPQARHGSLPSPTLPSVAANGTALAAARRRRLRQRAYASALAWRTSQQQRVVSQVARMAERAHDAATVSSRDAARTLAAMYAVMESRQRTAHHRARRQASDEVRLGPSPLDSWIKPGEALAIAAAAAGAALAGRPPVAAPSKPQRAGPKFTRTPRSTCAACSQPCCCQSQTSAPPRCARVTPRRRARSAAAARRAPRAPTASAKSAAHGRPWQIAACPSPGDAPNLASAVHQASEALATAGASVSQLEAAALVADRDRQRLQRVAWALNA
mmetsp:Transcript_552/g.2195  ORF Transcript_552/g.2195 Transcript_552/m.2195 type:complete len:492 (-) Transcript_552:39-1514(-)